MSIGSKLLLPHKEARILARRGSGKSSGSGSGIPKNKSPTVQRKVKSAIISNSIVQRTETKKCAPLRPECALSKGLDVRSPKARVCAHQRPESAYPGGLNVRTPKA